MEQGAQDPGKGDLLDLLQARAIVWISFTLSCIALRGILTHPLFLRLAIEDKCTRKYRDVDWAHTVCDGRRTRVLWAFRSLTGTCVPWLVKLYGWPENGIAAAVIWYVYF